jgi:hypothetical protein
MNGFVGDVPGWQASLGSWDALLAYSVSAMEASLVRTSPDWIDGLRGRAGRSLPP